MKPAYQTLETQTSGGVGAELKIYIDDFKIVSDFYSFPL